MKESFKSCHRNLIEYSHIHTNFALGIYPKYKILFLYIEMNQQNVGLVKGSYIFVFVLRFKQNLNHNSTEWIAESGLS